MLQNDVQNCARVMKGDKPCIALMGEFSAGKTTLINFLLGEEILPTQVTATHVPPVWISHGNGDPFYIDTQNHQHQLDLMDIQSLDVANVRYIKIFSESEILEDLDLIDTPGISDPNIPAFHKDTAIENADAMIWCTHATQAWRESERSAWVSLPEELRESSILLATRSDKLDERSRDRVRRRLVREAGELFGHIIMFSATDALLAVQDEDLDELLESSGGLALLNTLSELTSGLAEASAAANVAAVRPMRVHRQPGSERGRAATVSNLNAPNDHMAEPGAPLVLEASEQVSTNSDDYVEHDAEDQRSEGAFWSDETSDTYDDTEQDSDEPADDDNSEMLYAFDTEDEDEDDNSDDHQRLQSVHDMLRAVPDSGQSNPTKMTHAAPVRNAPSSARDLWQMTLADNNVETVADVLAAIEEFVDRLDQHGLFAKPE